MRIYLIGLPGSGKTTLGRGLARRLGWVFTDTDALVASAAGTPVHDAFRLLGEPAFRALEMQQLHAATAGPAPCVIATGGGLPAQPGAMSYMNENGLTLWLDVPPGVVLQRLMRSPNPRPLLQGPDPAARLAELHAQRLPCYSQAQVRLSGTGLTVADALRVLAPWLPPQAG